MSNPIAISLALTGARYSPWLKQNERIVLPEPNFYTMHMPVTPEAVAEDVAHGHGIRTWRVSTFNRSPQIRFILSLDEYYE